VSSPITGPLGGLAINLLFLDFHGMVGHMKATTLWNKGGG
jgi:hypothetical protein